MPKEKAIRELEDLPGIGPTSAEKLRAAGIDTLDKVAVAFPSNISEISGISQDKAKEAITAAREATTISYETAATLLKRREAIGRISTGSKDLDDLIGGGVETDAITEVYGRFASGKSQIGFQLSVNVQLPLKKGGLDGGVLFLDTEGTFRPERIVSIAKKAGLDQEKVIENIVVIRAMTTEQQMLTLERADKLIQERNIKLIVVDSLTSLFRAEYLGRGALNERQQKLNSHIRRLAILSNKYNLAVYVTNQVMDNPGMMFGDPTTPIGGNILAHAATTMLYIRKSKEEKRIVRLVDSPNMPEGECVIKITPDGIV
ncbi:MAG: DNA repair and recombination protein RadA [Candidatus Marsarchaeota archaeon]|jgi:DNA repair protein RadA|nr:DNA repair and recombination protein RadA [Candidatus Marsarchaeota archaeon]MCL5115329.1 DNA repair and recombination protein RadA [Candidatus Marsarchaeota archaeon]